NPPTTRSRAADRGAPVVACTGSELQTTTPGLDPQRVLQRFAPLRNLRLNGTPGSAPDRAAHLHGRLGRDSRGLALRECRVRLHQQLWRELVQPQAMLLCAAD